MTETVEQGAPFIFAMGRPPTGTAIDDDIYLTVTAAVPGMTGEGEAIDIILSVEFARQAIAALSMAVNAAGPDDAV